MRTAYLILAIVLLVAIVGLSVMPKHSAMAFVRAGGAVPGSCDPMFLYYPDHNPQESVYGYECHPTNFDYIPGSCCRQV